jgi:hypothetical protein
VRIGNCYWWSIERVPEKVFNGANKKAVYLGDSWGTYHLQANPKEIERLWKLENPNATIINYSQGGMTTKYARAWFKKCVLDEKPDILILEYFTNDINSILTGKGLNFTNPEGQLVSGIVNESEYLENIRYMVDESIKNGIQPVVILPAAVAGDTQTQYHAQYSSKLANGGSVTPSEGSFKSMKTESATSNIVLTDRIETKTDVNVPLEVIPSTAGIVIKPRLTMYAGTVLSMINSTSEIVNISVFGGTGYTKDAVLTITSISLKPLDVLPTPSVTHRNKIVTINGNAGIADKIYRCIKNAADTYEWKEM